MHSAGENRSTNSHLSISDVRRTTLTLIALSTMLLIFASLAQAQTETLFRGASSVAGPNRPSTVPEGYLVTPFGYFHPSCVQSLAKGDRQLADGRVQHADGSIEQHLAVCNYPRYTPTGFLANTGMSAEALILPEVSGWLEGCAHAPFGVCYQWRVHIEGSQIAIFLHHPGVSTIGILNRWR